MLVVRGFLQEYGMDYLDTFSLVIKTTTIRIVLSLVVDKGLSVKQVEVNNVFCMGTLLWMYT